MVLKPGREAEAEAIFRKWELDFAVIGEVTDTGRMVLEWNGETVCDIPLGPLADEAPLYERPFVRTPSRPQPLTDIPESTDIAADLLKLMASPDIASRRWIWEQYDSQVGADTVQRSGGDAAVVRVHGTKKALAMTTDCTPRYCYADPYRGRQAGGRRSLSQSLRGRRQAARDHQLPQLRQSPAARDHGPDRRLPRRHGRSLPRARLPDRQRQRLALQRNQGRRRHRQRHPPHPRDRRRRGARRLGEERDDCVQGEGSTLVLLGHSSSQVGQSLWLSVCHGRRDGPPPPVDLQIERRAGELVRQLIEEGLVTAVHDISDGGAAGRDCRNGARRVHRRRHDPAQCSQSRGAMLFGEDQGRFLVTARDKTRVCSSPRRPTLCCANWYDWRRCGLDRDEAIRNRQARRPPRRARGLLPRADGRRRRAGLVLPRAEGLPEPWSRPCSAGHSPVA